METPRIHIPENATEHDLGEAYLRATILMPEMLQMMGEVLGEINESLKWIEHIMYRRAQKDKILTDGDIVEHDGTN